MSSAQTDNFLILDLGIFQGNFVNILKRFPQPHTSFIFASLENDLFIQFHNVIGLSLFILFLFSSQGLSDIIMREATCILGMG